MNRATPPQVLTKTPNGRTMLFTFEAGQGVPPHKHAHAHVTIAVLSGQVAVTTDQLRAMQAGEVTTYAGDGDISLLAQADSRVLVCLVNN